MDFSAIDYSYFCCFCSKEFLWVERLRYFIVALPGSTIYLFCRHLLRACVMSQALQSLCCLFRKHQKHDGFYNPVKQSFKGWGILFSRCLFVFSSNFARAFTLMIRCTFVIKING